PMSPEGSTILFRRVPVDVRRGLERSLGSFAAKLEAEVTRGKAFDCLITTDSELRGLNHTFRGKDTATDVLSFPSTGPRLGDLAISLQRARAQAKHFGHAVEQEIRILMLHGVLHLLGMDHEDDSGRMARAEKRWRARLGLPPGLTERVNP